MGNNLFHREVTIDVSEDDDLSNAAHIGDAVLVGVMMPAAWTAANITFEASVDGETFGAVVDSDGDPITLTTPGAGEFVAITSTLLAGAEYLKVATSAGQAADRTIGLSLKK